MKICIHFINYLKHSGDVSPEDVWGSRGVAPYINLQNWMELIARSRDSKTDTCIQYRLYRLTARAHCFFIHTLTTHGAEHNL
jgi:hypothetical protein